MRKPKQKRILLRKDGRYYPQFKWLFWWRTYTNHCNNRYEAFFFYKDADEYLKAKHYQDLQEIKQYNARGVIEWEPHE